LTGLLLLGSCSADDSQQQPDDATGTMFDLPTSILDLPIVDLDCDGWGEECYVVWPNTLYEAGGCVEGECGPIWSGFFPMLPSPDPLTCEQLCGLDLVECIPGGCSGKTGLVCVLGGEYGYHCDLGDPLNHPQFVLTGECDEIPPHPEGLEFGVEIAHLNCCCAGS
jgi:hypothetical protein